MNNSNFTYLKSGVDIKKTTNLVKFISKLSKSVANKDLMPIFKELKEENSTNKAFQIISLAIDLDFPKGLKTDVVKHYNSLEKNYLAQVCFS
jgi:hypothetical protein